MRLENPERIVIFLISLALPAVAIWWWVGEDAATNIRILASLGASFLALVVVFAWSLFKLPAMMDAEAEAARKILEDERVTEEQRRLKREMLGEFLDRGLKLMTSAQNYDLPPCVDEGNKWLNELIEHLETNMGRSYVARVNDGSSAPVGYSSSTNQEHNKLYNGVRIRVFHIQEFLKEMGREV